MRVSPGREFDNAGDARMQGHVDHGYGFDHVESTAEVGHRSPESCGPHASNHDNVFLWKLRSVHTHANAFALDR